MSEKPKHFKTPADFRRWLERHHASEKEIWLRFYKKSAGRGGMVYHQALDEALCFGWIDGQARGSDNESYAQRFTPRRPGSIWSLRNIEHVKRLTAEGRMRPAGLATFEARSPARTGVYSFEQKSLTFPRAFEKLFRADRTAWTFWQKQPPGYRRTAIWWVISAKQEATQRRRLARLISDSAAGRRLPGK